MYEDDEEEKLYELILRAESGETPATPGEIDNRFAEVVDHILANVEHAREMQDSSIYLELENRLGKVRSDIRESVQALSHPAMWQIILKLRRGDALEETEMRLIRFWVVGDAEAYVKEENNFPVWLEELDRLTTEVRRLRSGPVDLESLEELNGVLADALGVSRSIAVFLNDRERVERFDESISHGLDEKSRTMLADILSRSYNSRLI
jgi:hypothetical protein